MRRDWRTEGLVIPLRLTLVVALMAVVAAVTISPADVAARNLSAVATPTIVACAGLAVIRLQRRTIEAVERSRATPDELAAALRIAATKTRAPADPSAVPSHRG